jgi:hypothetical protein
MPDGATEEVRRLAAFRREHPDVLIGREFGRWQAVIPQQAGERTLAGRGSITGLLDEVETILAAEPDTG